MLFDRVFYGNSVRAWLVAAAALAVVFATLYFLRRLVTRRFAPAAGRTATAFDDLAVQLARRTRPYFLFAIAVVIAVRFLELPLRINQLLDKAVALVVLLQAARWATGVVAFYVARHVEQRRGTADAANL